MEPAICFGDLARGREPDKMCLGCMDYESCKVNTKPPTGKQTRACFQNLARIDNPIQAKCIICPEAIQCGAGRYPIRNFKLPGRLAVHAPKPYGEYGRYLR